MTMSDTPLAYVRKEDAPFLPPPANTVGVQGWLRENLFSGLLNSALTIVFGTLVVMVAWRVFNFAIVDAVWSGADREACVGEATGACWPMIAAKMPQWIYGFYPIDQRWRVNLCFLAFALGVIPMLIPSAPYKKWNALYLFLLFPLITLVLLTGGNFNFSPATYAIMAPSVAEAFVRYRWWASRLVLGAVIVLTGPAITDLFGRLGNVIGDRYGGPALAGVLFQGWLVAELVASRWGRTPDATPNAHTTSVAVASPGA